MFIISAVMFTASLVLASFVVEGSGFIGMICGLYACFTASASVASFCFGMNALG